MKLTMDPSKYTLKALETLVHGTCDREMLLELFVVTDKIRVRQAIIKNRSLSPDDREFLYDKATNKSVLYGAFLESELNSATIDKIVEDAGDNLINCYEVVQQDKIPTEILKKVCNHIIQNKGKLEPGRAYKLFEYTVENDNADEETIEMAIAADPRVMPKVMLRHDVTVKIILNK